jgi:hypothetical protein
MNTLALAYGMSLILQCAPLTTANFVDSERGFNEHDLRMLAQAKKRCPELYPKSPCLGLFIKKRELTYWAVCRPEID